MKCKRCKYVWLPCGSREIPKTGNLYMTDVGICTTCGNAKSRLHVATPGDIVNAELWGMQRFEVKKMELSEEA